MFDLKAASAVSVKNDVLSGLTVALALVPEAVAFAFVAGVEPLVGLYAAFMVGLITAVIGGRPGMISGATGALAVVMVALVADHGVEYLFAAVVLMGIIQIIAGVLHLGRFIQMVPHPVMLGFVNGLAIVIFLAQLGQFGVKGEPGWLTGTSLEGSVIDVAWLEGQTLYVMLGLVALTMAIIRFLPLLTTAIPSSLAAILVISGLVIGLDIDTRVVGDVAGIAGGLPEFHIPEITHTDERMIGERILTLWKVIAKMCSPRLLAMQGRLGYGHGHSQKIINFPALNKFLIHGQPLGPHCGFPYPIFEFMQNLHSFTKPFFGTKNSGFFRHCSTHHGADSSNIVLS